MGKPIASDGPTKTYHHHNHRRNKEKENKDNNENDKFVKSRFSVNLLENVSKHITFLQNLHSLGVTLRKPSKESVHRYRNCWLPLVFQQQQNDPRRNTAHGTKTKQLIPPSDVAWLWHCHRLAPYRYSMYIKETFGNRPPILEANPPFTFQDHRQQQQQQQEQQQNHDDEQLQHAMLETKKLWEELYPEESFFLLDKNNNNDDDNENDHKRSHDETNDGSNTNNHDDDDDDFTSSRIHAGRKTKEDEEDESTNIMMLFHGYDLIGSTQRQVTFLRQVSGIRFLTDTEFIHEGLHNYYKFLKLKKYSIIYNNTITKVIVPTYQIDLFWHTHILSHVQSYFNDCKSIIGQTLNHDDSLDDRTKGSTLDVAFRGTKALWKEMYKEVYYVNGGMYRGEPPREYYTEAWAQYPIVANSSCGSPSTTPVLGPYLNMVNIHGSTATSGSRPVEEWTALNRTAPDGKPAIIMKVSNPYYANGLIDDYIFGCPVEGGGIYGYYHITTRQAYEILCTRIDTMIQLYEKDIATQRCMEQTCSCGRQRSSRSGTEITNPTIEIEEEKIIELKKMRGIAHARSKAEFPVGFIGLQSVKDDDNDDYSQYLYYTSDGIWKFPDNLYDAGGGCGGRSAGWRETGWNCGQHAGCGGGGCGGGGCGGCGG